MSTGLRLLVKTRNSTPKLSFGSDKDRTGGASTPLFRSIGQGRSKSAPATFSWHVVTIASADTDNPWQACHHLVRQSAATSAPIDFAEPDLQQHWLIRREDMSGLSIAGTCVAANGPDLDYPTIAGDPLWLRDLAHGQYDAALGELTDPGEGKRVRIAHLDTGYDPTHQTLPSFLNRSLQRNFVDPASPQDAQDETSGLFNNLGHGTGTLSILAGAGVNGGKPFGVAPFSEVIPIRVANRVVLFSNSAIAQAFDYVHSLCRTSSTRVHVMTLSMGGIASRAWAEAVNAVYEAGVFIVAAAGNNYANLPIREIVYPARFNRVVAACGVMADGHPYADLSPRLMAGNYGPAEKMKTALAAYTPNTPWARLGCRTIVDLDGNGTSASTPQVAGTAALWIQKNRRAYDAYSAPWMRVEAVRTALFESARFEASLEDHLGRGRLAARDALHIAPARESALTQQPADDVIFPIFDLVALTGLDAQPAGRQAMLELEALQTVQLSGLSADVRSAAGTRDPRAAMRVADALLAKSALSKELRKALEGGAPRPLIPGAATASKAAAKGHRNHETPATNKKVSPRFADPVGELHLRLARHPAIPRPPNRKLQVFAFDPSLSNDLDTAEMNLATIAIRWEDNLKPGPVGDYLEVVDVDPASGCCYAPVDLNHPYLIAQNGLAPSEAHPQFHQQMVYAVAMRTVEFFEQAIGRAALWSTQQIFDRQGNLVREEFVRRLRIYPHAIRAPNAYYSGDRKALLLGYFNARSDDAGASLPSGRIFCALSHDIVAHEAAHALLDGLHRRYQEPTNPDMLAFHEAFADIVALFQHFTIPEALLSQVKRTRGDFESESLLGQLAVQFGQATHGGYAALRSAIGELTPEGKWKPIKPSRSDYDQTKEPHALGSVLVSAIFAAFVKIYRMRTADLIRLATGGTGVLPAGEISQDLSWRLTNEASKLAIHILTICIRALDYCPPVDLDFGDYLRALITADRDLVPNDVRGYRIAFIAAFRDRGIYPSNVPALSVESAVWEPPPLPLNDLDGLLKTLDLEWTLYSERGTAFETSRKNSLAFRKWLLDPLREAELAALGFEAANPNMTVSGVTGALSPIEIHSVRPTRRTGPDGQNQTSLVVEITQTLRSVQDNQQYCNGSTLIIDMSTAQAAYFIRKKMKTVIEGQLAYQAGLQDMENKALRANYFDPRTKNREPFALLHRTP
jgi:hypothetical protein